MAKSNKIGITLYGDKITREKRYNKVEQEYYYVRSENYIQLNIFNGQKVHVGTLAYDAESNRIALFDNNANMIHEFDIPES
jgi:hypothetical protein